MITGSVAKGVVRQVLSSRSLLVGVEISTTLLENNLAMYIKSLGMVSSFDPAPSL